ncbi:dr1-associated corepressor homolog isoform X4 [Sander lucioperca]|uniref:dr1-associated corepressor homolog isoform X4 n=1 Tax=Sander lucioperca TaxID=283035 RepID=UPI00125D09CF|nr:dr1-associated corepressor homolog isoform X4 [Sander lucioperca]
MPGQKRKYNVRFPPGRIKKIMQKDTEVGRIAMAVPVIICILFKPVKQCIESEEHFHFLRDRAERATSKASQKDKRGMSMWPMYRTNWHDISVKKADVVDVAPRRSLDSLDNDSSSGESELFICL